jgi:5-methylcytosine-specific restriction endonuclease McrA
VRGFAGAGYIHCGGQPARRAAERKERMKPPYREYLKSSEWAVVRRLALEQADNACRMCGSTQQLDVHHRTYERLGSERLADVVVLCHKCHGDYHAKRQASGMWMSAS